MENSSITVSAPGKIHLLGEHAVVYGKPALLAAIDLRVTVKLNPTTYIDPIVHMYVRNTIEAVVKKYLKITNIPPYGSEISSQLPIGCGLGSSAAVSAAYIAALLTFLNIKWDKPLVNDLTYEAEKVFHGNPSGGDNSTVVYGGLVWFRKQSHNRKLIQPLNSPIPAQLAKNFILINTGKPKETTKQMVEIVSSKFNPSTSLRARLQSAKFRKLFDDQEQLVKGLVTVLKEGDENKLIQIIRAGEKNLESMGVVSSYVASIIRKIEKAGGAAKICGGGGKTKATGILLCYHPNKAIIEKIAEGNSLPFFSVDLGVEGLRKE